MLVINWVINPSENKGLLLLLLVSELVLFSQGGGGGMDSSGEPRTFHDLGTLPVDFYELNSYGYAAQVFPLTNHSFEYMQ